MNAPDPEQVVRDSNQRLQRIEQILPTLATKEELRAAVAPLATKEELRAAVETLRIEIREGNENNLRQFQILAEGLRSEIRLIADSFMGTFQIHETEHEGLGRQVANHEDRITRLEATRRRPRP